MWILTREENLYDQEGEYFSSAWTNKPTREQLCRELSRSDGEWVDHLLKGGGRRGYAQTWYNLFEYKENT